MDLSAQDGQVSAALVRTKRLVLRNMVAADAEALCRIVTHPEVGPMLLRFPPDWTPGAAREFIHETRFRDMLPFRLGVAWADAPARLIGSVGVHVGDEPDIFYFIGPADAGRGAGREAMVGFLSFLFARFQPVALRADVFDDNPASKKILSALGFEPAGRGMGRSAARLEPAPISLYRLSKARFESLSR